MQDVTYLRTNCRCKTVREKISDIAYNLPVTSIFISLLTVMGAGASSRANNKPEVHVVVVQQRATEENHCSSNNTVDDSNVDSEFIQTALKAAKLTNGTNEMR